MDGGLVFLALLAIAWAVGTPIMAIVALVRSSGLREQNERLAAELAMLRRQIEGGVIAPAPLAAEPVSIEQTALPAEDLPPPVESLPPPFGEAVPPPAPVWEPQAPQP